MSVSAVVDEVVLADAVVAAAPGKSPEAPPEVDAAEALPESMSSSKGTSFSLGSLFCRFLAADSSCCSCFLCSLAIFTSISKLFSLKKFGKLSDGTFPEVPDVLELVAGRLGGVLVRRDDLAGDGEPGARS